MATILVVEDELNQQRLYQMELEDEGHRVLVSSNGQDALRQVEAERPDLVVVDLFYPTWMQRRPWAR